MTKETLIQPVSPLIARHHPPELLLHCCCGPCSTHVLQLLRPLFHVTAYFYNPNIHPSHEHQLRLSNMQRLAAHFDIPLLSPEYDPKPWLHAVRGHEPQPEGGSRCLICYRLRLENAALCAAQNGFHWFASTLSISPHKSAQAINSIGQEIAHRFGLQFYTADFKKKDGFRISAHMSAQLALYRQNYCGCFLSRRNADAEPSPQPRTNVAPKTSRYREDDLLDLART